MTLTPEEARRHLGEFVRVVSVGSRKHRVRGILVAAGRKKVTVRLFRHQHELVDLPYRKVSLWGAMNAAS